MKLTKIVAFALVAMLLVFAVSCAPEAEKKHVHEKGTPHGAVAGTCRTKGTLAYWDCTGCEAKLDVDGKVMASIEGVKDPSNHTGSASWAKKETTPGNYDMTNHWEYYACCDTFTDNFEAHVLENPTTCTVCGSID